MISHTLDGRLIATDKATGKVAWQRQVADPDKGEAVTGAPLVVKNMAITGVAGGEFGIRGWLAATDLTTQKEVWRTYTIPGKGERGGRYLEAAPTTPRPSGGGPTWVTGSYDPASNTLYLGHRQPRPRLEQLSIGPATTFIPTARWRSTCRHRQAEVALSSTRRTTRTTTTAFRRTCWSTSRTVQRHADEAGAGPLTATASPTRWTARPASSFGALPFVKQLTWTAGLEPQNRQAASSMTRPSRCRRYNASVTPSARKPGDGHLPRQYGRQELAADRLQPGAAAAGTSR